MRLRGVECNPRAGTRRHSTAGSSCSHDGRHPPPRSVSEDLDTIVEDLADEFALLAGKRLLVTGGAGFLGYYLVQAALRSNEIASREPIRVTVYDNYVRGLPAWLEQLAGTEHLALVRHDIRMPAPGRHRRLRVRHPRRRNRVADLLPHASDRDDGRQHQRPALAARLRRSGSAERGRPVEGFLFFSSSEIYGDPTPENIPTPETYRGNVSCTGPRACYDESKRYGETLCVNFAAQHGLPVTIARPFNNYGPGLKITDRRVIPDFARDILDGRDIVMLSDGPPTRTFCYVADAVVGLLQGAGRAADAGEAYNIGVEEPEISMRELGRPAASTSAASSSATRAPSSGVTSDERDYLVDNPSAALSRHREGSRATSATSRRCALDEGLRRSLHLVRREPRVGRGLMRVAIVGTGYVGLVTGVCLADKGHDVMCVDLDEDTGRARSTPGARRSSRRGSTSCSSATSASASARRPTSQRPSGAPT